MTNERFPLSKDVKAWILDKAAQIESAPLRLIERPKPVPKAGEVLIRVQACAMCRTDLHLIEGDIPTPILPITPGHQIVGEIELCGEGVAYLRPGDRVGVPWLNSACGACSYCLSHHENLCDNGQFTGQHVDGGYAEYVSAPATFVYPLDKTISPVYQAPLLCSGVIGYRALKLAQIPAGGKIGLYGFGSSAHITLMVAHKLGASCYVISRREASLIHARKLGAAWAGLPTESPPALLDSVIIFAPDGGMVVRALSHIKKGGSVICAGIHMSDFTAIPYEKIWGERRIQSVTNSTRADVRELLSIAALAKLKPDITEFPFATMNENLHALKAGTFVGTGVVRI